MATHPSAADNIAVVREFFEELFSGGDLDWIDESVADDAVGHDPYRLEPVHGREGVKGLVSMYRSAFPDLSFDIQETLSDGEWVAVWWVPR